ncbi:hypothetical protein CEXT_32221 [Caerostris extrusa]|uniref:Uncharacterized protein n=1 Tax=Caerostris extrusa TaxID=172846 RepID=A0AAV4YBZ2_CAEEX|nr:hypothetical protein CEXT_32221 [Caerostris extrusa]
MCIFTGKHLLLKQAKEEAKLKLNNFDKKEKKFKEYEAKGSIDPYLRFVRQWVTVLKDLVLQNFIKLHRSISL